VLPGNPLYGTGLIFDAPTYAPTPQGGGYTPTQQTDPGQPPDSGGGPTCEGIVINEFLPNPSGSDAGHEFIELYNPTKAAIALDGCSLQTSAGSKTYDLSGAVLQPGQYQAFYDSQTGLTLPNSAGGTVWLLSPTDELQSIDYPANMADDVAWARFNDAWQATYAPTPNAANISMPQAPCPAGQYRDSATNRCRDIATSSSTTLKPCAPDQYRNPATNRCKAKISAATLAACAANQYRNPATNRCKLISSTSGSLKPCKPGHERNPATNRCKSTASSNSLKPCKPGWIRNPATNRCRKGAVKGASIAGIKDVSSPTATGSTQWWLAAGAVLAALGYALYEWRQEITARLTGAKSHLFNAARAK
jgi:Lamin Tail Domain